MLNKSDLKVEYMRGTGPGGQNRNKRETACRITHLPTGIQSYEDKRTQEASYRMALANLESGSLKPSRKRRRLSRRLVETKLFTITLLSGLTPSPEEWSRIIALARKLL